jgi:hypothetical protein
MTIEMRRPVPVDLEPKRKNRWMMSIGDIGVDSWMVQTSSRPTVEINEVEIPYMNTSTYIAGRSVWSTIDIEFIDVIGPSTSQKVMDWIRECIEHSTGRMGYAVNYKKQIELKMLDPTGQPIEHWTLEGAFPTNANFGDLDMSSDDLATVSMTIRFDRAILNY